MDSILIEPWNPQEIDSPHCLQSQIVRLFLELYLHVGFLVFLLYLNVLPVRFFHCGVLNVR